VTERDKPEPAREAKAIHGGPWTGPS